MTGRGEAIERCSAEGIQRQLRFRHRSWERVEGDGLEFEEIVYQKKFHSELEGGMARVTIDKPKKYNVMTVATVEEMFRAFYDANHDTAQHVSASR